jgi:hypothetical protein
MHRSGTSAVCAALAASGVSFGSQLLDPMAGVNDEGFWEDARVVELNEQLLALAHSTWFAPDPGIANIEWGSIEYDSLRAAAIDILKGGFGASSPQAVKDPRLCLTLPFWLACCEQLDIRVGVCAVNRAPLEVARSLEHRDGFPIGYGLRLYLRYRQCMVKSLPPKDTFYIRYDELLLDPSCAIANVAEKFQLALQVGMATAVRGELRHQFADAGSAQDALELANCSEPDLAAVAHAIEMHYPLETTLGDFARRFTSRGLDLARIGQAHTLALATLDERDEQIREFDRRLAKLGDEHSHALQVLRERDADVARLSQRLESITALPGVRLLMKFRSLLKTK